MFHLEPTPISLKVFFSTTGKIKHFTRFFLLSIYHFFLKFIEKSKFKLKMSYSEKCLFLNEIVWFLFCIIVYNRKNLVKCFVFPVLTNEDGVPVVTETV